MTSSELLTFLNGIPSVAWTVIAGFISTVLTASVTLLGIWLTNKGNNKRLENQLKHDAKEKDKDRTAKIRHEIYLKAAEEMVRAQKLLLASQLDPTQNSSNSLYEMQDFFAVSIKFQLVAESESARKMVSLTESYEGAVIRLSSKAIPLNETKSKIAETEKLREFTGGEVSRLLKEERDILESGNINENRLGVIRNSLSEYQKYSNNFIGENERLLERHRAQYYELVAFAVNEMKVIGRKQVALMTEIRKDLGLLEVEKEGAESRSHWQEMEGEMGKMLKALEDADAASRATTEN